VLKVEDKEISQQIHHQINHQINPIIVCEINLLKFKKNQWNQY